MVGKASRPFLSSVVAVVLASALQPRLGSAQISVEDTSPWLTEVGFVGINAVLGGVTAGVTSLIRGNSFSDAFTAGALGGTMSYAGKRVAASRFYGAGLIGRQELKIICCVGRPGSHQAMRHFRRRNAGYLGQRASDQRTRNANAKLAQDQLMPDQPLPRR